jgi:DNA-binding CsgD family transcriptional regulator
MTARFVGRRQELGVIAGLVGRARRDRLPTTSVIVGDPGTGKSRLLRQAVTDLEPKRLVTVAGLEPTAQIPFAAVGELVRRLGSVPEHGPRLEGLVFGAADAGQGVLPVLEGAHRALAAFGPLVLAIDDLQWVDAQSIALIQYLARAAEGTGGPLAIVAASRPAAAASEFEAAIATMLPAERRTSIQLGGLPLEDALELAKAIDPSVDPARIARLWERSGGSPFWLEGLVRAGAGGDTDDLIGDRLRALSEDAGLALGALVVGARPFATEEIADVLGWSLDRVGPALRELETRGLTARVLGGLRLSHDLIRESAARQVPDARQRQLHGQIAKHIEAAAGDDLRLLVEALDHRVAASLPRADLAVRILHSPSRRLLDVDALARLENVTEELERRSLDRRELEVALARLAGELGQNEMAIRLWDRVAASAPQADVAIEAALGAGRAAYFLARPMAVRAYVSRARALALDPTASIEVDALAADVALWLDHDTPAGRTLADGALERGNQLIEDAGGITGLETATIAAILHAVEASADAALQQDRGDDVIRLAELSMRLGERLDGEARIAALLRSGFALRALRHLEEALRRYRDSLETARRLILPAQIAEAGQGVARVLRDLGRLEEARSIAQETVELEQRIGVVSRRWGTSRTILRTVQVSIGVSGAFERMRQEARTQRDPHFAIGMHELAAAVLARQHGPAAAAEVDEELQSARVASALAGCKRCTRELTIVSAEVLARMGRIDEARRELESWQAGLEGTGYRMRDLWQRRAEISIAAAERRPEAPAMLADLSQAYEEIGLLEDVIWTELDRGQLLRAAGDRGGAVGAYERAATIAERIGADGHARRAARALRELGVRAWRRGPRPEPDGSPGVGGQPGELDALSARERQVATLVARGASNRDIAEELVLSPKTVERHVTNILAKVGARNRTELARLVHAGPVRVSPDD